MAVRWQVGRTSRHRAADVTTTPRRRNNVTAASTAARCCSIPAKVGAVVASVSEVRGAGLGCCPSASARGTAPDSGGGRFVEWLTGRFREADEAPLARSRNCHRADLRPGSVWLQRWRSPRSAAAVDARDDAGSERSAVDDGRPRCRQRLRGRREAGALRHRQRHPHDRADPRPTR